MLWEQHLVQAIINVPGCVIMSYVSSPWCFLLPPLQGMLFWLLGKDHGLFKDNYQSPHPNKLSMLCQWFFLPRLQCFKPNSQRFSHQNANSTYGHWFARIFWWILDWKFSGQPIIALYLICTAELSFWAARLSSLLCGARCKPVARSMTQRGSKKPK